MDTIQRAETKINCGLTKDQAFAEIEAEDRKVGKTRAMDEGKYWGFCDV